MATLSELTARLAEAEAALHALMTGTRTVSLSDGEGHSQTFTQASRAGLTAYIAELKGQIAVAGGSGGVRRRPIGVTF